ncbi:MAG: neuraminidase-like domain-containing protein, partial [Sphingobium sp.]
GRLLPGGEASADEIFRAARNPAMDADGIAARIAELTGWDAAELKALAAAIGVALPQDLADEAELERLASAVRRLRRLGTTTAQAQSWAAPAPDADAGTAARRAVQAAYGPEQWPDAIRPLEDVLREKRRAALVAYLTVRPDSSNRETWTNTDEMFGHLLIDVETQPVVLTSRLKQAIGSVQLGIQRFFMNLDPYVVTDAAADAGWTQWPWLKQYRVWEANRKIFLYPENWIEPELRDDKSPFFEELETTLLQADLTNDLAETAYASYLARLDEVARLDVVGMFNQPGEGGAPDELHVFGCTRNDPPVHFYRKWVGQARWTPWQRLDLDIPRGSILPLVWNRRLYLFWPIFTLKSKNPPAGGDKPVEGKPFYEIQLAWSEQRQGRWGPKKTVPSDVILESKLSVSMARTPEREHVFRASIDGGDLRIWYEATYSKADQLDNYGNVVSKGGAPVTNGWLFSGCNGSVTIFTPSNVGVYPPPGMSAVGMCYAERIPSTGSFQLPKGMTGTDPEVVLRFTPGNSRFRVLSPHQERTLTGQLPLFFHDDSQIYFIVPRQAMEWTFRWPQAEGINPQIVDIIHQQYYEPNRLIDPLGPIAQIYDPAPVIRQRFEKETAGRSGPSIGAFTIAPVVPVLTTAGLSGVVEGKSVTTRSARVALNTAVTPQAATKIVAVGDHRIVDIQEYLRPERLTDSVYLAGSSAIVRRYEFQSFYHPYACTMMRELNMHGVGGLLVRWVQMMKATPFEGRYGPTAMVEKGDATALDKYPVEDMDFRFDGAYAIYNWELFFHVPLMIACKLSQNQRFEEAQKWFHAIFDPTDASAAPSPAKFWRTRPFFEQEDYLKQRIDALLEALAKGEADENLSRQVSEWVANPFRPFAVARLRTVAFQKMVVMKYIDNLIAWGDQLFRRDTIESINEATQLYILAAQILGPRPPVLTPRAQPEVHNFRTLMPKFEELTNELTSIESIISSPRVDAVLTSPDSPPLPVPQMLYFCVTPNDKLLGYWDTVADRLFKIRNSLNLAGIRRTLPLFEPPIDPALLVKAAAAGVDLSSAIADMAAPGPLYRFPVLAQKAAELCQEVKGLGAALLQALERRDSEELARIQSVHEISLMKEVKKVRDNEIRDAKAQIVALEAAREQTAERYRHSMTLLGKAPVIPPEGTAAADAETVPGAATKIKEGVRMIAQEASQLDEMAKAADAEEAAADWDVASNLSYYIPEFHVDVKPWGIGAGVDFGGRHVGPALTAIANKWRSSAADHRHKSEKASRLASYIMRANDWRLEANLAAREMAKVDKDLAAARIREAIATVNRDNHLKDIEQREQAGEFLRSKYTNRELYDWMIGQISAVYFQAYQLAYDTARRAEQSFRRELAVPDTDYIRFGYWDSLRKGLLAGDRLLHDVHRMELAYLDQNAREYEITKHVSLANLHPEGLMALQEQGSCFLDLPEAIFDLDHAGHYMRRIKAVHVTIPCVTGPYTSIPCKLILLANRTRVDPRPTPQYGATGAEDRRFEFNSGGIRSVVISSGRDDSGSFEFNLRDERYLPFEGAGVISSWRLELPAEFRQFDYRTISDVILHIRYTAREGGDPLKLAATRQLADALKAMEVERGREGLAQGLSARQSFPDAWHAFAYKPDAQPGVQTLSLPIDPRRFPGFASGRVKVDRLLVALIPAAGIGYDNQDGITLTLTPPGGQPVELKLESIPARAGGLPMAEAILPAPVKIAAPKPGQPVAPWTLEIAGLPEGFARTVTVDDAEVKRLDPAKVADVALLLGYTI